ncbi:N-acetylmuramoyl-L-alanine amidase [Gracilibacillus xinjiangensis]|uniref:N-acetylmuramoyl-L-alanine amidase n=1 Tax=Gracilibacillus xinjiangensis TaxID=1193282 RepID=A0ABV8WW09_9BACI
MSNIELNWLEGDYLRKKVLIVILLILILSLSMSFVIYAKEAYINGEQLNVRSGPGTAFDAIGKVNPPDVYPILKETEDWVKIDYNGQTGWVSKDYVTIEESDLITKDNPNNSQVNEQRSIIPPGLHGKVIVIDPGHGGRDVGAISVSEDFESTYTLKTAKVLAEFLEANGAIVHFTREDDRYITLFSRSTFANTVHADAFLSIHYNSTPEHPEVAGVSTFFYNSRDQSLAEIVQDGIITETGMENRGIKQADLQVLRTNHRPGILLELGFLSNQQEENHIRSRIFLEAVSTGVVTGLQQYFQN